MTTSLAPLAPSLFELEAELQSLLDTEDIVSGEQEESFRAELIAALQASVEKRDRVGAFLRHCEMQSGNCDEEIARLRDRKKSFDRATERVKQYVQAVLERLGTDDRGKYRKLEGKTITFSLRSCPPSVDVHDEELVPTRYKRLTVTIPMDVWEALFPQEQLSDSDDPIRQELLEAMRETAQISVLKRAIKEAIDSGLDVPGADLTIGSHSLVVK